MRQRAFLLFCALVLLVSTGALSPGLYGKKKPKTPIAVAVPQMTPDQKELHALNRLTFGARSGDIEQIKQAGLDHWIDAQLHPETIAENPVLEAKLAPLDSLRMSTAEMLQTYPSQQMVKAMIDGRMPLPADPTARAGVKIAMARYEQKKAGDAPQSLDMAPKPQEPAEFRNALAAMPLTEEQKTTLAKGGPEDRVAVLQTLPPDRLLAILEALPNGMRARLALAAPPDLRRKIQVLTTPMQTVNRDLTEGKLLRDVYSNRQLEQVLTDFWYNHFNVYLDKGSDRSLVTAYERDVIRPHVLGKFKDMLLATAQSPAMLFYLDNWQSVGPAAIVQGSQKSNPKRRQGLNENYGRELMELHTLGVDGGYTQQDVTEVARCFTGWTLKQPQRGGDFQFNAKMHDDGEKEVLGVTIPAGGGINDGLKVLDILEHHPSTAHFIARSLAIRFVSDDPPEPLVTRMAATFTSSDGDIREVMRTMLASPEFWDPAAFRSKVKSPLEMVVSAIRAVNGDIETATAVAGLMNQLGEPLYRKQEPTGYSNRGGDWMNSASLLARMNFANSLAQAKIPGVKVDTTRFTGDPKQIERGLLFTEPTPDALAAIEAGLDEQKGITPDRIGSLVAGLTLGSPDFQRR
jgi:uncharacterized protein (DUF1800 family)